MATHVHSASRSHATRAVKSVRELEGTVAPSEEETRDLFQPLGMQETVAHHIRHFHNAASARDEGRRIAANHVRSDGSYDVAGTARVFLNYFRQPTHTQAERGSIYAAALAAMPPAAARQVALTVMGGIPAAKLDRIGRAGLAALRDAGPGDAAVAAINRELHRRGPVRDVVVHGVHIIGDEISPRAMELAKDYVKKMTRNPEAAAALAGTRLVIIPHDERITDQDLVYEQLGLHGERTFDGRPWDEIRGEGGVSEMDRMNVVSVGEEDLVRKIGKKKIDGHGIPRFSTTTHELSHSVKMRFLDQLPATDPRLLALLPPGVTVDPSKKGRDVLEAAWSYRKSHHMIPDEYARENPDEWFAVASEGYLADSMNANARWLQRRDPTFFNLLHSLYGSPLHA